MAGGGKTPGISALKGTSRAPQFGVFCQECWAQLLGMKRSRSPIPRHAEVTMLARMLAVSLSVALLTLVSATAARASYPHERDGMILGFNLGGGSAGIDVPGANTTREGGFGGNFRVGYAFSPQIAAGLEGNMWTKNVDNETWTFSVGGPALTYYPGATGFF